MQIKTVEDHIYKHMQKIKLKENIVRNRGFLY